MNDLKQVILVRSDINMSKGKLAAQVAHAAVEATLNSNKKLVSNWRSAGQKKITLKVSSKDELLQFQKAAQDLDLTTALIIDAGHTELEPGTTTCLAIGPGPQVQIDKVTKDLKPF